jgi:hypothetical protein
MEQEFSFLTKDDQANNIQEPAANTASSDQEEARQGAQRISPRGPTHSFALLSPWTQWQQAADRAICGRSLDKTRTPCAGACYWASNLPGHSPFSCLALFVDPLVFSPTPAPAAASAPFPFPSPSIWPRAALPLRSLPLPFSSTDCDSLTPLRLQSLQSIDRHSFTVSRQLTRLRFSIRPVATKIHPSRTLFYPPNHSRTSQSSK